MHTSIFDPGKKNFIWTFKEVRAVITQVISQATECFEWVIEKPWIAAEGGFSQNRVHILLMGNRFGAEVVCDQSQAESNVKLEPPVSSSKFRRSECSSTTLALAQSPEGESILRDQRLEQL